MESSASHPEISPEPVPSPRPPLARWLAADPFRLFFPLGVLWSVAGVLLWPLYYAGALGFYPGVIHSRLMIEAFGGAFVIGFMGTAGPRHIGAPPLSPPELGLLLALHISNALLLIFLKIPAADVCFLALLATLFLSLLVRLIRFRNEWPDPAFIPAGAGLLCGICGTLMWLNPAWIASPDSWRLANLMVNQGLLLLPVLGFGPMLFPRPPEKSGARATAMALGITGLVLASFLIEAAGFPISGCLLRAGSAAVWLWHGMRLRPHSGSAPAGTLTRGLPWAVIPGIAGLGATGFFYDQRVGMEHLLYICLFGLLMLIIGSRVLFGHSGNSAGFRSRSWIARLIIGAVFTAGLTRTSASLFPRIMVSHHLYAAALWIAAALMWTVWHRNRFRTPDPSDAN